MILLFDSLGVVTYHNDISLIHCRDRLYPNPNHDGRRSYSIGFTSCVSISNKYILIDTQFSDQILKIRDPEYRVAVNLLKTWIRNNKLEIIGV